MNNRTQFLILCAGVFIGMGIILGFQSIAKYDSFTALLAEETASAHVRNYGLLAVGLITFAVAALRYGLSVQQHALDKQSKTEQQRQDKRSALFDRFQKSSEMLDSSNMAVRQAGLYTLAEIAKEQPDEFYIMVQSLFCGFLRQASREQKQLCKDLSFTLGFYIARTPEWPPIRADMLDAINLFSQLRKVIPCSKIIENSANYTAELSGLFLAGGTFQGIDFSNSNFQQSIFCDAKLINVVFDKCDLNGVYMDRAIIEGCAMTNCRFGELYFRWAEITDLVLTGFEDNWVDFTGAVATNFEYSKKGERDAIPFKALVNFGSSEPQFEDTAEQAYERIQAKKKEAQEETDAIEANFDSQ